MHESEDSPMKLNVLETVQTVQSCQEPTQYRRKKHIIIRNIIQKSSRIFALFCMVTYLICSAIGMDSFENKSTFSGHVELPYDVGYF